MGSACCVAARERAIPSRAESEPSCRNIACSSSWSFRLDNRRRVAGEIEEPSYHFSHGISRNISMEMKGALGSGRVNLSDLGSPLGNYGTPTSQKSPVHEVGRNLSTPFSDISTASNCSREIRNEAESPDNPDASTPKLSYPMTSSFSPPVTGTAHTHLHPRSSAPSRKARRSPGNRLLKQVSDSRILGLKSPTNYSLSEGRSSFVLSASGNDLMAGSHGGFSDGWSLRTFSELVASSQRERWSFDSEHLGSGYGKISGCSSSRFSYSPSVDLQTCSSCSKRLTERSSSFANEISAVAVLVCGHVYHAECLEKMTSEADRYDPLCPVCVVGEKQVSKMSKRALKAEAKFKLRSLKMLKNRVIDSYVDGGGDDCHPRQEGKAPKRGPSSSSRRSLPKPFFRRHFSIGSKWGRSLLETDSPRKKGFLSKYWKD